MLRSLRDKSQSIFFKLFLVIIVLGFAVWGVGDLTGNNNNQIVFKTKKHEISSSEIIQDFDRLRNSISIPLNSEDAIKNGLLNQVLLKFKLKILIDEEGTSKNLSIPREHLLTQISNDQMFQSDGVFLLNYLRTPWLEIIYLKIHIWICSTPKIYKNKFYFQ